MTETANLPPDTVEVEGGKVKRVRHWVMWGGVPWNTIDIERVGDGLKCSLSDPEHGGGPKECDIEQVADQFGTNIGSMYHMLFSLENATKDAIRSTGMRGVQVLFR